MEQEDNEIEEAKNKEIEDMGNCITNDIIKKIDIRLVNIGYAWNVSMDNGIIFVSKDNPYDLQMREVLNGIIMNSNYLDSESDYRRIENINNNVERIFLKSDTYSGIIDLAYHLLENAKINGRRLKYVHGIRDFRAGISKQTVRVNKSNPRLVDCVEEWPNYLPV